MRRRDLDAPAVHADVVGRRVGLGAELVIVAPFTLTRPSRISCSDARRDATPACEGSSATVPCRVIMLHCPLLRSAPAAMKPLIIAIDGPSGAGKGTVARAVASALGYRHVDSGAMYRAVGWKALQAGPRI